MYQPHSDEATEYNKACKNQIDMSKNHYNLPKSYDQTIAVLQIIDPFRLHLYWDIEKNSLNYARTQTSICDSCNSNRAVIRLFKGVSSKLDEKNYSLCAEYEIDLDYEGYYIKVPEDDKNYFVQIGLVTKNKLFSQIVHSNTVHTPKHGVSELYDPEWMSIEELLSDRHIRCWSGISSQDINLSFKSKNIICSGSGNIM